MALKKINGLGNTRLIQLATELGGWEKVIKVDFKHLEKFSFIKQKTFEEIKSISESDLDKARADFDYCSNNNITVISFFDERFPPKLKGIPSPPSAIFAKGKLSNLNKPAISFVGSRSSTEKSKEWTFKFAKELAEKDYVVVSGAARGIDTAAHAGALSSNGRTIAVLGCGLENIYPKENESLITEIIENGLVVSEYPPSENVTRISLLERNRITSGLGNALLLVTALDGGGSMSQVKNAIAQRKQIFVPPPGLGLEPSVGVLRLIRENKASQIKNVDELLNIASHQTL